MIKIDAVILKLSDDTELKMSIEDARNLYDELKNLFDKQNFYTVPTYPTWTYPTWTQPTITPLKYEPFVVTCTSGFLNVGSKEKL